MKFENFNVTIPGFGSAFAPVIRTPQGSAQVSSGCTRCGRSGIRAGEVVYLNWNMSAGTASFTHEVCPPQEEVTNESDEVTTIKEAETLLTKAQVTEGKAAEIQRLANDMKKVERRAQQLAEQKQVLDQLQKITVAANPAIPQGVAYAMDTSKWTLTAGNGSGWQNLGTISGGGLEFPRMTVSTWTPTTSGSASNQTMTLTAKGSGNVVVQAKPKRQDCNLCGRFFIDGRAGDENLCEHLRGEIGV